MRRRRRRYDGICWRFLWNLALRSSCRWLFTSPPFLLLRGARMVLRQDTETSTTVGAHPSFAHLLTFLRSAAPRLLGHFARYTLGADRRFARYMLASCC